MALCQGIYDVYACRPSWIYTTGRYLALGQGIYDVYHWVYVCRPSWIYTTGRYLAPGQGIYDVYHWVYVCRPSWIHIYQSLQASLTMYLTYTPKYTSEYIVEIFSTLSTNYIYTFPPSGIRGYIPSRHAIYNETEGRVVYIACRDGIYTRIP